MLRFLDAHGFEHTPRLLGWYRYAGAPITATLGILQEFVPDARDGWQDALASLADPARLPLAPAPAGRGDRAHARGAGRRTTATPPSGRRSSASAADDDARGAARARLPEPVRGRSERAARAPARAAPRGRRRQGDPPARRLPPRPGAVGARRLARARLRGRARAAAGRAPRARARRCATSRACCARSPTPPRRAARAGRRAPPELGAATRAAPSSTATSAAIDQSLLPPAGAPRDALLAACELEKALYELRYELDNRPDWVHVPLAGILRLLAGVKRV